MTRRAAAAEGISAAGEALRVLRSANSARRRLGPDDPPQGYRKDDLPVFHGSVGDIGIFQVRLTTIGQEDSYLIEMWSESRKQPVASLNLSEARALAAMLDAVLEAQR